VTNDFLVRLRRGLESPAPADRCNLKIQLRVHRVAAFFDQRFGGFPGRANLHEYRLVPMMKFAEMGAQATLTVMNLQHV
jgi:hypothetical protein